MPLFPKNVPLPWSYRCCTSSGCQVLFAKKLHSSHPQQFSSSDVSRCFQACSLAGRPRLFPISNPSSLLELWCFVPWLERLNPGISNGCMMAKYETSGVRWGKIKAPLTISHDLSLQSRAQWLLYISSWASMV